MQRYFIELAYRGTAFHGFQIQDNVLTVQGEMNRGLQTLLKTEIQTLTSSRTDAGVHARQNYLHFDTDLPMRDSFTYNLNAIIHQDIVVKKIIPVESDAHSRFDATARQYSYHIIQQKNPFLIETSYYFPFTLNQEAMHTATQTILGKHDFTSFSKRHTDVNNFLCEIDLAYWEFLPEEIVFHIRANRFLRGMVRALVATLLQVGRNKISVQEFTDILNIKDCTRADFSAEAQGLFLERVYFPFIESNR